MGDVVGRSVNLFSTGRDIQVLDHVFQNSDRLSGLLARGGGNGVNVDGRHPD